MSLSNGDEGTNGRFGIQRTFPIPASPFASWGAIIVLPTLAERALATISSSSCGIRSIINSFGWGDAGAGGNEGAGSFVGDGTERFADVELAAGF
jgi:hypothetical protein